MKKLFRALFVIAPALTVFMIVLALPKVEAETSFNTASVTQTSQYVFFQTPRSAVTICNASASANVLYFRLFNSLDTPAVATTASSPVAIGACVSFSKAPTQPTYFSALSLVCDSGQTATANVFSE